MTKALLLSGSIVLVMLAIGALAASLLLAVHVSEGARTKALAKRQPMPGRPWKPVVMVLAIGFLLFFVLFTAALIGLQQFVVHRDSADMQSRQARYDACLMRTTPEVCEVHWVRRPANRNDE